MPPIGLGELKEIVEFVEVGKVGGVGKFEEVVEVAEVVEVGTAEFGIFNCFPPFSTIFIFLNPFSTVLHRCYYPRPPRDSVSSLYQGWS